MISEISRLQEEQCTAARATALHGVFLSTNVSNLRSTSAALRQWSVFAFVRAWTPVLEEARRLYATEREVGHLSKQVVSSARELKEERNAHQQTLSRLKSERRSAVALRQEKEGHAQREQKLTAELEKARRMEEAAKGASASLKRELNEVRHAYASTYEERQPPPLLKSQLQPPPPIAIQRRVAMQRDVALQEVGDLAHELESLQVALTSRARSPRRFDQSSDARSNSAAGFR